MTEATSPAARVKSGRGDGAGRGWAPCAAAPLGWRAGPAFLSPAVPTCQPPAFPGSDAGAQAGPRRLLRGVKGQETPVSAVAGSVRNSPQRGAGGQRRHPVGGAGSGLGPLCLPSAPCSHGGPRPGDPGPSPAQQHVTLLGKDTWPRGTLTSKSEVLQAYGLRTWPRSPVNSEMLRKRSSSPGTRSDGEGRRTSWGSALCILLI